MESLLNSKIDDLFNEITNSIEYKSYIEIKEILEKNQEIMSVINEIKDLQKEATRLEYNNDIKYKTIDKNIKNKINILNNYPIYIDFLNKKEELNDMLSASSNIINKYIDDIIN